MITKKKPLKIQISHQKFTKKIQKNHKQIAN